MAEVGSAYVSLLPSAKGFGRKLDSSIGPDLDRSGKSGSKRFGTSFLGGLKGTLKPAAALLGGLGVAGVLKDSIAEAREAQKVGALTVSTIKATGGAAKVTAKQVGDLSSALSLKTGIDDEVIQSGANMLLTFKNIRNEAGKGNDVFNQSTAVLTDLSAAMGTEPRQAAIQLGKALNDPIKGVTALTRVGVTFTKGQKDQIKALVQSGKTLDAQKIILKELNSEFGGAAEAQATAGDKLKVSFGNLEETIGTALLPVIDKLDEKLVSDIIPAVSDFVTGIQDGTGAGGAFADTLGDIWSAAKPVAGVLLSVVDGFAGLDGAAQKTILLGGAIALLSAKTAGLRASAGEAILNLRTMPDAERNAAVGAIALRAGSAAAAAGLALLAMKAGGASTDLGTLATVGAGIAGGFAIGGPWGAAIGGGASLLSVFSSRSDAAAQAQQRFDTAGKQVAATLNQQSGALTKLTRETAAKTLADQGAFTAAQKVGVSYKDVLDAALGNAAATKRVDAATKAYLQTQEGGFDSTVKAGKVAGALTKAVHGTAGALADQRDKINQVNAAMGRGKNKTVTYTVKTPGLSGAIGGLAALGRQIQNVIDKQAKVKNVGSNAKGTNNWRGGLTWVGEEGPELINLAKGAQVIPNNKISSVGTFSAGPGASIPDMPIVDGSQVIGYLRDVATKTARIEIADNNFNQERAVLS